MVKRRLDVLEKNVREYRDISKLLFASQSFVAMKGSQPHEAKTEIPHKFTKLRKSGSNTGI